MSNQRANNKNCLEDLCSILERLDHRTLLTIIAYRKEIDLARDKGSKLRSKILMSYEKRRKVQSNKVMENNKEFEYKVEEKISELKKIVTKTNLTDEEIQWVYSLLSRLEKSVVNGNLDKVLNSEALLSKIDFPDSYWKTYYDISLIVELISSLEATRIIK